MKACSFCGRLEIAVRKMIVGNGPSAPAICDRCVTRATKDELFVAHCASCTVRDGKHDPACEAQS
jgi:hypothetical protein